MSKAGEEQKNKAAKEGAAAEAACEKISSKNELKTYLAEIKEKLAAKKAAPVYVASSMQYIFTLPNIDEVMDKANLETCRGIWMKLKEAGMQLHNPPILFPDGARLQ